MPQPNSSHSSHSLSDTSGAARPALESIVAVAKHLDLVEPRLEEGRFSPPDRSAEVRRPESIQLFGQAAPVMFPELMRVLPKLNARLQESSTPSESGVPADLAVTGPLTAELSVLSRSNAMVILQSEQGVAADFPTLAVIAREAFGETAPSGLSQIVLVNNLGSWSDPSGASVSPILATIPDAKGVMYLDASILNDRERTINVLKRVGELTDRLAYEQHGADSSLGSMQRSAAKLDSFEAPDAESPYGYLTREGRRYPICLSGAVRFDGSIYPPFHNEAEQSAGKAIIIDSERDAALWRMYSEFDAVLRTLPSHPRDIELLALASAFIDSKVRNKAEHSLPLPEGPDVLLGAYYTIGGGECRQKALLLGCLTEHLRATNRFSASITFHAAYSYVVADAHAYLECQAANGAVYFADPTHHRFVSMAYDEPTVTKDGGIWPYRSVAQIESLRGSALWYP